MTIETRPDWLGRFFSVRVGVSMKAHWRKESQYADIAAVWRLANWMVCRLSFYSEDVDYGEIFAR